MESKQNHINVMLSSEEHDRQTGWVESKLNHINVKLNRDPTYYRKLDSRTLCNGG